MSASINAIAAQIRQRYPDDAYTAYHAQRYALLLTLLSEYRSQIEQGILDIGRTHFTDILSDWFGLPVDSLGFGKDQSTATGHHYGFDLRETMSPATCRADLPQYGIILLAEVIEHLPISPLWVLRFLYQRLHPGGLLILQTPNAADLVKRLRLLRGHNPYELIREDLTEPGHFREYTLSELVEYAQRCDFTVEKQFLGNYFSFEYVHQDRLWFYRALKYVYRWMPARLQPGITLILSKKAS